MSVSKRPREKPRWILRTKGSCESHYGPPECIDVSLACFDMSYFSGRGLVILIARPGDTGLSSQLFVRLKQEELVQGQPELQSEFQPKLHREYLSQKQNKVVFLFKREKYSGRTLANHARPQAQY